MSNLNVLMTRIEERDADKRRTEKEAHLAKSQRQAARDDRSASESREKKRKKKEKKKKSKKKKKKKSRKSESEESSSCSDSEDEWTEKEGSVALELPEPATRLVAAAERDEWMSLPGLFPSVTKERKQPQKREDTEKMMLDTLGQSKYELNPYWKGGGTGLPSEEKEVTAMAGGTVGDRGADWLRRALTRTREQAREEGRSVEEVAAERWGSLAKLEAMLAAAEAKSGRNNNTARQATAGCEPRNSTDDSRGSGRGYQDGKGGNDSERRSYRYNRGGRGDDRDRRDDRGGRERRDDNRDRERRGRDSEAGGRGEDRSRMFQRPSNEGEDGEQQRSRFRKPDEESRGEYNSRRDITSSPRRPEGGGSWRKKEFVESRRESPPGSPNQKRDRRRSPRNDDRREGRTSPVRKQPEVAPDRIGATVMAPAVDSKVLVGVDSKVALPERKVAPPSALMAVQSSSDEEPMEVEAPKVSASLTDKELNELGAKLVKAEIMGNTALADELREKLDAARAVRSTAPARPAVSSQRETEVVILTRTDARGMVRPVSASAAEAYGGGGGRRKKGKVETHDRDGQRVRYFPDDDDRSLRDMFESEKLSTVEDSNKMFSDMAGKVKPSDDMSDIFEDRACRQSSSSNASRERSLAMGEAKQKGKVLDSCMLCMDSGRMMKHLVVAIGTKSYLSLPPQQSLTEGHCFIVPLGHVPCGTQLDEDVWAEMKTFRSALTAMFLKKEQDVVYLETAMNLRKFPHAFIECIPMPTETGHMAPIYFKKAIQECETEWSTNKKLVDTSKKDVRRSIPKGLPYFSVDFGNDGGFAHVIEDEAAFPRNFAQEIVGGMLDLDHRLWRKPQRDNFESQRKKVLQFTEWWKLYDFTKGQQSGSDSD